MKILQKEPSCFRGTFRPQRGRLPRQLFTFHYSLFTCSTVGYYNVEVKAGKYNLIAINIDPVSEKTYTLDELFPADTANIKTTSGGTAGAADQLRTWDVENQSFNYYYRFYKKMGGGEKNWHWVNQDDDSLATEKLKAGDSVFYYALSVDQTHSVPGQVPNSASGILKKGYNMISVGFPARWNPNDEGVDFWKDTEKWTAGGTAGAADEIRYWDSVNQVYKYYYLFYKKMGGGDKNYKWVDSDTDEILTEALEVGNGFFFIRKADGEIPFTPNLKLN